MMTGAVKLYSEGKSIKDSIKTRLLLVDACWSQKLSQPHIPFFSGFLSSVFALSVGQSRVLTKLAPLPCAD